MCNFMSGIIQYKHKGVWFDVDLDSHTDIMEKFKIKDEKKNPPWLKFEYRPVDGDVFNHDRTNWKFHIDDDHSQDSIPDWFDAVRAEEQAWECLQKVIAERFLIGVKDYFTISAGRWYAKDSNLNLTGGTLNDMRGGTLNNMRGGTLNDMTGGTLNNMRGGTLNNMRGGTLNNMTGGTLNKQSGSSRVFMGYKILVADKHYAIEVVEPTTTGGGAA